jgi:hypothetical protein
MSEPRGPRERWAEILYRRVVALYPAAFRQKYGPEVQLLVRDLADDPSVPAWRLWLMLWRDLGRSLLREHLENLTGAPSIIRWKALAQGSGGVAAMVAAFMIIAASTLPYQYFPMEFGKQRFDWYSILYSRIPAGGRWFAAEPVGIAVLAIVAGVVLVVSMSPIPRAVASGVLLAYGVQTVLLFGGYVYQATHIFYWESGSPTASPSDITVVTLAPLGPGGIVGILAGILLFVGGLAPCINRFARKPARQRAWAGTAGGVIAMLAAPALIAAGALPYFYCNGSAKTACVTGVQSFSVFGWGFLYSGEMATVLFGIEALAIVAGMVLVVRVSRRITRAIASGVLLACGVQIIFLFGGYFAAGASVAPFNSGIRGELDSGAIVGMLAGLLLLSGGVAHAGTLFPRKPFPAPKEPSTG